jgi:uncharacterized protein
MSVKDQEKIGCMVRIYFNEDNLHDGSPLADYLMQEVQKAGLRGATIFRGVMGFGNHNLIHSTTLLRWTESLPLILEIMDTEERLMAWVEKSRPSMTECLIIRIPVEPLSFVAE